MSHLESNVISKVTGGRWINLDGSTSFSHISTHNSNAKNSLYASIKGLTMNAESVINALGASAAIVSVQDADEMYSGLKIPLLIVGDVKASLISIAKYTRGLIKAPMIAVTGSVGKSGFKHQVRHLLKKQCEVCASSNSRNLDYPILCNLSSANIQLDVGIIEVAGSEPHTCARRSNWILPDICVITNLSLEHMRYHKTIGCMLKNKADIVRGLSPEGVCFLNSDNEFFEQIKYAIRKIRKDISIKTFGSKEESDARLVSYVYDVKSYSWDVESNIEGKSVKYRVPILGDHAPLMSTLALLTVSHLGYDVKKSSKCYSSFKSSQTMGRLYEIEMGSGSFQFLDHSYRISIPSAKSAIKSLSYFHHKDRGRKIAVLTEIYEMSEKYCKWSYSKIAKMINNSGIDIIYIYGKEFFSIVKENIDSNIKIKEFKDDSIEEVLDEINVGDIVMVQGQPHVKCSMSLVREIYKKGQVKNIIGNSHLIPQKSR